MNIQKAVAAPRFHHQWLPDIITFEPNKFKRNLFDSLQKKGYDIKEEYNRIIGRVDAIKVSDKGIISTGADPRGVDEASLLY